MPNIELKFSGETFAEVVEAALRFAQEQAVSETATLSYPIDEGLPTSSVVEAPTTLSEHPVTNPMPAAPASDDPKVVYAVKRDTDTTLIPLKQLDLEDAVNASGVELPFPTEQIEDDGMVTVYPPITHEEPTPAVEDPNVDSAGVAYDPRIHTDNRAKKMDGTWKKKRGVNKETIEAVKSGEAGPAPVVHDTRKTFANLMNCLSKAVASGKFDLTQLDLMHQSLGVTNVQQLNGDPEKIAQAVMFIKTVVDVTSEGTE